MRVLHVCTEIYPLLKTGGLADVAGALPVAQAKTGCDARVLVPGDRRQRDSGVYQANGMSDGAKAASLRIWALGYCPSRLRKVSRLLTLIACR